MRNEIDVRKDRETQASSGLFPEFERMAERFFGDRLPSLFADWPSMSRGMTTNVREEEDAYLLSADLPGIPKEDIEIQVSGNMLTIHAEHKSETGKSEPSGYRREYRTFHQSFTLPSNVNADQVEASCENGRLEVLLPKNERDQARKVEVKSGLSGFSEKSPGKDQEAERAPRSFATQSKH